MMDRRGFVAGTVSLLIVSLAAEAQPTKIPIPPAVLGRADEVLE
jgi:hypothetical protein